jgi:anti-sigma B factor antagonist
MRRRLALFDSIAGSAYALPPVFVRSWANRDPEAVWVHVAGDLNVATAPQLARTLREPRLEAPLVVLDLRDLVQIDSSGVHAIVNAAIRTRQAGHRLVLLRGPPNVDRVFTLTGSSGDLQIVDVDLVEAPVQVLLQLADQVLV